MLLFFFLLISAILPISLVAFHVLYYYLNRGSFQNTSVPVESPHDSTFQIEENPINLKTIKLYAHWLLILSMLSFVQNGMVPSIASYILLSYNNNTYVLANTISNCISPAVAMMVAFLSKIFVNEINILTTFLGMIGCSIYMLIVASSAPNVPLITGGGSKLIIAVYVLCYAFISMCKTSIIIMIKQKILTNEAMTKGYDNTVKIGDIPETKYMKRKLDKAMERVGIAVQCGSFTGTVVFFYFSKCSTSIHPILTIVCVHIVFFWLS